MFAYPLGIRFLPMWDLSHTQGITFLHKWYLSPQAVQGIAQRQITLVRAAFEFQ